MKKYIRTALLCLLAGTALAACQTAAGASTPIPAPTLNPTEKPATWQTVADLQSPPVMQLAGFNDAKFGISVGDDSQAVFSTDGGATWQPSKIDAFQLFGLDIVDRNVAWTCGNPSVRVTTDGAQTWQVASDFGSHSPDHCRFLSFLDAKTGWAATSAKLVATSDGATTWIETVLPDTVDKIAAISLYASGSGCLLAQSGALFCTTDNGKTWPPAGTLPLGNLTIATMNPPVAAMRFTNPKHGLVIIPSAAGGTTQVVAFHTSDGGTSWTQEIVVSAFGFPVLSHDSRILTLFCLPSRLLVLQYNG